MEVIFQASLVAAFTTTNIEAYPGKIEPTSVTEKVPKAFGATVKNMKKSTKRAVCLLPDKETTQDNLHESKKRKYNALESKRRNVITTLKNTLAVLVCADKKLSFVNTLIETNHLIYSEWQKNDTQVTVSARDGVNQHPNNKDVRLSNLPVVPKNILHKKAEAIRRKHLTERFTETKTLLNTYGSTEPNLEELGEKASKKLILERAIDCVEKIKLKNKCLSTPIPTPAESGPALSNNQIDDSSQPEIINIETSKPETMPYQVNRKISLHLNISEPPFIPIADDNNKTLSSPLDGYPARYDNPFDKAFIALMPESSKASKLFQLVLKM